MKQENLAVLSDGRTVTKYTVSCGDTTASERTAADGERRRL